MAADFDLAFVLSACVEAGLLAAAQARDVAAQEAAARRRVALVTGADAAQVSPVEIVAAFQVPLVGRQGELVDEDRITEACARRAHMEYRKIDLLRIDPRAAARHLTRPFATKHRVLPLEGGESPLAPLVVAVANPFDGHLLEELRRVAGVTVRPVLAAKGEILKGIADVYGFRRTLVAAESEHASTAPGIASFEQLVSLSSGQELDASDRPVVQAVEHLLRSAFDLRASDIHVEPKRDHSLVRLRIDGVLHGVFTLPAAVHAPVLSRIKMLARCDIAEKRRPQDGRIKIDRGGREVELRVSSLPTAFGEKAVLRIFDPETLVLDLARVGFDDADRVLFESWIAEPHGLILVTGPTGSGKTTTLYSALKVLAGPDLNVVTVEDPIEMICEAFNQVQVQPKLGLDFATALRHILRQDPDVIMVGEIRDPETAEIAVQSALTGHLVLSTLHTNDAAGAVGRLVDLGVAPFLLASSLVGVMAQRLLRRVCGACAVERPLTEAELDALEVPRAALADLSTVRAGAGCSKCRGTGYYGRVPVFELLPVAGILRELVAGKAGWARLVEAARGLGRPSLRSAALRKLAQGVTSVDEVLRMTSGCDEEKA